MQQSLFLWLQPVFAVSSDRDRLRKSVEHWITELAGLATRVRRLRKEPPDADTLQAARKRIDGRIKRIYDNLRQRVLREAPGVVADQFLENWKEHYRAIVSETVRGESTGRVQFCRQHSTLFVDYVLDGKPIPVREHLTARDLISRGQQIVFDRLGRLIEGRLLPLAGGKIDTIIVERVAFDILSGPIKARLKMSEEEASRIYWHGPQAGFASRLEMFKAEFDGRCAYCGEQGATNEVEHILHRSQFPFDSYFNLLPACGGCNAKKAGRTALESQLVVHDEAYLAYCDFLAQRKVLHPFHTIKKGMLNLLRRPATVDRGQQMIALIADNLVSITNTQRSPRPLARYLATRLAITTGNRPKIVHRAARHTALYRGAALPDYDKAEEKLDGDLRNHAVDAIMLACDFPSASALENSQWTRTREDVNQWKEKVQAAAPEMAGRLPSVSAPPMVRHFEEDAGDGYCVISLSAFNWNRRRKAAHKLDPFGKTASGIPLKRTPAAAILDDLVADTKRRDKQISLIAHRGLRKLLEANRATAGSEFVAWLQATVRAGLRAAQMSNHPADVARRQLLQRFTETDPAAILSRESPETIPWIIGVKVLNADTGAPRKVNVVRSLANNPKAQHYQSEAVIKALYVGYRKGESGLDRSRPIVFALSQIDELSRQVGGRWTPLELSEGHALRGRPLGSSEKWSEFRRRWSEALRALLAAEQIEQVFRISQGNVIEKTDGSQFQLRNFDKSEPWMSSSTFKDIQRVHRSPFKVMG